MLDGMANVFLPDCSPAVMSLDESVAERKVFYRLGESEIFTFANKNSTSNGVSLVDIIPRMVIADHGFIQVGLDKFDKTVRYELFESNRFKLGCRKTMINMLETGKVVLVYSEEYRVPTSIPYIAQVNGKNTKIYANISDFVEMDQYGILQVTQTRNYNAIMALILAACASYKIITSTSALPADLADGMILMYASMLERVINSLVHMDPVMQDKIRYLASEFILVQMYGTEKGTERFYRIKEKYFPKLSKMIMDSIDNQFHVDSFDTLTLFIEELKAMYPSMKGLSLYLIYDKWIRTYGPATAMSVDYFGYHVYTVAMVLMESPLISRMALEPVLEKNRGSDIYKRLQALIGTN